MWRGRVLHDGPPAPAPAAMLEAVAGEISA
jgi:hypothetical protein